tara:strand:+ start:317 stop:1660 length:1344 start_codon:yes stop_codon:yes gene_type:complete
MYSFLRIFLRPLLILRKFSNRDDNSLFFGKIISKFNRINAIEKKNKFINVKNSKKIFIIGPSIVRSLSLHKDFIPLNCFSATNSCFFNDQKKNNVTNYMRILKKIRPGKIVVLALATHDPDLALRKDVMNYEKGYKRISKKVLDNLKISADNNLKIAKYSKKILKHETINLLGWPHINSNVSKATSLYNRILKKKFQENSMNFIDISEDLKEKKNVNINKVWRVSENNFHLKNSVSKFLVKKICLLNKKIGTFKKYTWKNIIYFKFKDTDNIALSPLPYKGSLNALNPLVQYSHIENKIAKILIGYSFEKNLKKIFLYNCGEGSLALKFPPNFFKEIILINKFQDTFELAEEIIEFTNRREILSSKDIHIKKVKNSIIFINLDKGIKQIKNIQRLSKENSNEVLVFGKKSLLKEILIKTKKNPILIKNFNDQILGNAYYNFELIKLN